MKIRDHKAWDAWVANNTDIYGGAVISYAKRWAEVMEERMEAGAAIEDIAKQASRDADEEGITGFMYGAAVSVLSSCWEHGEVLRRWHNLDTQIGNEGEVANDKGNVLNPALLTIDIGEDNAPKEQV